MVDEIYPEIRRLRYGYAGEALQESFGMLRAPCGLIIVEYDGTDRIAFIAALYPHGKVSLVKFLLRVHENLL